MICQKKFAIPFANCLRFVLDSVSPNQRQRHHALKPQLTFASARAVIESNAVEKVIRTHNDNRSPKWLEGLRWRVFKLRLSRQLDLRPYGYIVYFSWHSASPQPASQVIDKYLMVRSLASLVAQTRHLATS